ncbi:MAG: hypothetical protein PWR01_2480 [Clostridiales bacterium]|jgi:hypothetical protein|nr:hypothetical protein [Clostridiales bacterium]MDN5281407.1 hypothetical protein [Candidatus Ozemobacter sp.]
MKKVICLIALLSFLTSGSLLAFDENKFTSLLEGFNQTAVPIAAGMGKTDAMSGEKGGQNQSNDDFVWLKAEELNKQLEFMIQGIESAKGVATALAIIVNLCNSDKISVEVALTAIQILKLRAVFMKVFIANGDSELEIMINILQEHEDEYGKMVQAKTQANVAVNGRINNAVGQK